MSICQGWNHETSGAFEGGKFCMGLGGFGVNWCQVNSNMFTRFGFEQISCQQNAMFLADADWKSLAIWTRFWLQNSMFVYSPTNWRLPFFGVKFLMCASKIVLQLLLFFSHSSRWLRPCLLSLARRSTPPSFHGFLIWFHWFDWLHCAYWLVSVRSFDVVLWFLDVEIGGKQRKKVFGAVFQQGVDIQTNCRSEKTDKHVDSISYSLSWASPSWTRHDVPLKEQVPCPSWNSWLLLFSMGHSNMTCAQHVWASNTGLLAWFKLLTAIPQGQRICTEAVSAWLLLSDEPRSTTSMSWQHLGMKLTSVTWHWRKHMHQIHLKNAMHVVDFVETLKPKSIHSWFEWLFKADISQSKSRKSTTLQSSLCRCLSEAVNVRGESMQAAEPCGQEAPLKDVLRTLGLAESKLKDLHNMLWRGYKAVEWRLFCRVANLSIVFAWLLGGSCIPLLGRC